MIAAIKSQKDWCNKVLERTRGRKTDEQIAYVQKLISSTAMDEQFQKKCGATENEIKLCAAILDGEFEAMNLIYNFKSGPVAIDIDVNALVAKGLVVEEEKKVNKAKAKRIDISDDEFLDLVKK